MTMQYRWLALGGIVSMVGVMYSFVNDVRCGLFPAFHSTKKRGVYQIRERESCGDAELHGPHRHGGDVIHDPLALQLGCV